MGTWLRRMWTDEVAFKIAVLTVFQFAVALIGYMMQTGMIATGVPGGGQKYGAFLTAVAFLVRYVPVGSPSVRS